MVPVGLFKPTVTRYLLNGSTRTPNGQRVTKDTRGAVRQKGKARCWYGQYRNADGKICRVPLCENKEAARQLLAKLVLDAKMHRAGLADPFAAHRKRPLSAHLDEFRQALQARNDSEKHVRVTQQRVKAVMDGCGFTFFADVQASRVAAWLAEERKASRLSITTTNYYLRETKSFFAWLVKDSRAPHNPLAHLPYLNAATEAHRERRILAAWEFTAMLEAACTGKPVRYLPGRARFMLYLVAVETGFRAQELASLTPASFRLDGAAPTVTVEAAYSKHKREDVQPIRPELAALLRKWIGDRPADERLWPGSWWKNAAKLVQADLAEARKTWIETAGSDALERRRREDSDSLRYTNADGRVFDFHALRGQFVSSLASAGVSLPPLRSLARHSGVKTTLKHYARVQAFDTQAALDRLPPLPTFPAPERESLRATGTDPAPCALHARCTSVAQTADNGRQWLKAGEKDKPATPAGASTGATRRLITIDKGELGIETGGPSRIQTGDGGFAILKHVLGDSEGRTVPSGPLCGPL
jgi:integrase